MNLHPLFAGFNGENPYAVGAALGFAIHIETALGPLPTTLDPLQRARTGEGGDLQHFQFCGGWGAPGAHCLMFAKPLTSMAAELFRVGQGGTVRREPFMYAIANEDGAAHFAEGCVASEPHHLLEEVPDGGTVVPLYR